MKVFIEYEKNRNNKSLSTKAFMEVFEELNLSLNQREKDQCDRYVSFRLKSCHRIIIKDTWKLNKILGKKIPKTRKRKNLYIQ